MRGASAMRLSTPMRGSARLCVLLHRRCVAAAMRSAAKACGELHRAREHPVEGGVTHFTSCATFPQSALRKGGATGKVRVNPQLVKCVARVNPTIWGSSPGRPQVVNSAAIG